MIRIGSLFSGYGGLDLAVKQVLGGQVAWHVEYDKAPSRILDHHFPGVPNYGDVTQLDFRSVEPVDVLTGGYPCQPFSHAGLRKGINDERHLWPHVLRAIREMGPRLAILENVRGHLTLGFADVLADLADVGWSARWGVIRASDAGAPHQRARLFIIAYPSSRPLARPAEQHDRLRLTRERSGVASANPTGNGRTQGRAGPGQWTGSTGQLASNLSSIADSTGAGRVRAPQHEDDGADSGRGRRHDLADLGKGGGAPAADACDCQQQIDQGHDGLNGERAALRRGAVVTAGARGDGVDSVGALAGPHATDGGTSASDPEVNWGDYGPAIVRWERVIGRPAPAPTEPGRSGAPRLSPAFVEWMMGLPAGWVTDHAIGISRNDQLKALGNGVVPQQAALALDVLLQGATDDLRQAFAPL